MDRGARPALCLRVLGPSLPLLSAGAQFAVVETLAGRLTSPPARKYHFCVGIQGRNIMRKLMLIGSLSLAIAGPAGAEPSAGGMSGKSGQASGLRAKCEALVRKHNPSGSMRRGDRESAINRCIANGGRVQ